MSDVPEDPTNDEAVVTVVLVPANITQRWPTSRAWEIREGHLVIYDMSKVAPGYEIAVYAPGSWSRVYLDAFMHEGDA